MNKKKIKKKNIGSQTRVAGGGHVAGWQVAGGMAGGMAGGLRPFDPLDTHPRR